MKISYQWLKAYIDTDLPAAEISDILTNIGLEVEGMETCQPVRGGLEGVVIGEVLTCRKHPNADKLTVTTVDTGEKEPVQIICGAPNVEAGQKVAVATVGTTLYPGEKELVIKKARIRGESSEGMICAEDELGLGDKHDGIMVLDPSAVPGSAASDYFRITTDTVFEIGLTPNRIDASSHLGVARDLAAFLGQERKVEVRSPFPPQFAPDNDDLHIPVEIAEPAGCSRYSAVTLSGVRVQESPGWLKERLRSIGLAPINNVVDITNFVLHETGQPLHAFDVAQITGGRVIVKTLPEGTPFVTLDGMERKLLDSDLMICNETKGMCIAGVFGGIDSGVTGSTRDVFLESACFDPVYIRKTARYHQLSTDASFRFERGSDPNMTVKALQRAALLIREIAGGTISSEVVDVYPEPVEHFPVEISFDRVNRLIGNPIDPEVVRSILESLEIIIEERTEDKMMLRVPPYRVDVHREADVIEEILRIYGFNRVETDGGLRSTLSPSPRPDKERIIDLTSELLTSQGFFEMKSNSLTRSAYYDREDAPDPGAVRLSNPLSQDLALMRRNLLYGALEAIVYNINRKHSDLKLYEFGYCYHQKDRNRDKKVTERFGEELKLGIFLTGSEQSGNWNRPPLPSSFYSLKTYVERVLVRLGVDPLSLKQEPVPHPDYAEAVSYSSKGGPVVEFGTVASSLLGRFEIGQPVYAAEFHWERLLDLLADHRILFRPLAKFHTVTRDLSVMLDRDVAFRDLRDLAFRTEKKLLKEVTLFDVYEGEKIEKGKKSYALSFSLLDEEKTLTDKQIDKTMDRIARAFEKEFGAVIRGKENQ